MFLPTLDTIKRLYVEISNICCLQCKHCYYFSDHNNHLISDKELFFIIQWFKYNCRGSHIIFSGGEPLMRENLPHLLKKTNVDYGLSICLATNGVLAESNLLAEIKRYVNCICVSYDGIACFIPNDDFMKIKKGIEFISSSGIPLDLHSTICEANYKIIEEIIKDSIDIGAQRIDFNLLVKNKKVDDYENKNGKISLDAQKIDEAYLEIIRCIKKYKNKIHISHHILGKYELQNMIFLNKLRSPFWVAKGNGSLYPMIDVSQYWEISAKAYHSDFNLKKFNFFMDILHKTFLTSMNLIVNKKKIALNYFELLKQELSNKEESWDM